MIPFVGKQSALGTGKPVMLIKRFHQNEPIHESEAADRIPSRLLSLAWDQWCSLVVQGCRTLASRELPGYRGINILALLQAFLNLAT